MPLSTIYRGGRHYWLEETREPGENHQPVASNWQTLSHSVETSTLCPRGIRPQNFSVDRHWLPPSAVESLKKHFSQIFFSLTDQYKSNNFFNICYFFNIKKYIYNIYIILSISQPNNVITIFRIYFCFKIALKITNEQMKMECLTNYFCIILAMALNNIPISWGEAKTVIFF
jgi:hypothetical protein